MSLLGEVRYAARKLVRAPAFTVVAVATLALGIGANAAIFGLVDSVLLRSLPYPGADRLVMAWQDYTARGGPEDEWFSPANYLDWKAGSTSFEALGAFSGASATLTGDGDPEPLAGGAVTVEFFEALGARPVAGRLFATEEDVAGGPNVVVLGHALWQRRFGADPGIVGRAIQLNGESYEVVGVVQPGFEFPLLGGSDLFFPLGLDASDPSRGAIFIRVVGRLKPGVTLERAQTEVSGIAARLATDHPAYNSGVDGRLEPLRERLVGSVRAGLLALFAGVGAVLLIACVNLANLLLARSGIRRRESAVRAAMGAGAFRIARLPLLESLILAVAGAAAGLVLALWLMDALVGLSPLGLPDMFQPRLEWRVIAFTAALAAATAAGFGLIPALQAARPDLVSSLKEGGRGGSGRAPGRRALVVLQVAFALTLLIAAGLLTRSFAALQSVDPGFRAEGVLTFRVNAPASRYPEDEQTAAFYRSLLERFEGLSGVESAGMVSWAPFSGGDTDVSFVIEGEPAPAPGEAKVIWYRQADPDYFRTMRIPLLAGRTFTGADETGASPVAVLARSAAERFFPGTDAVGKRIKPGSDPGSDDPWVTIVGVVGSVRHLGLDSDPKLEMYLPHGAFPRRSMSIVLRTSGSDPTALAPAVRAAVKELDPNMAVAGLSTMESLVSGSVALPRFLSLCISAFGALALLLAAVGVYGVISQLVSQRTRELGIRMALGADRRTVLGMVLRQGAVLVAGGAILGLGAALLVARAIEGLLFQTSPVDPATYVGLPLLLGAVAFLATWIPARRAAAVDPMTALRNE
ncbi:MAG TPA: ABC transporter permease [Longimicrobiales bacterium]|nr:ABC transporter permease [Longimicrobiales bacterium]